MRALLTWAGGRAATDRSGESLEAAIAQADERQLQWVIDGGLAPLLYHAVRDRPEILPPPWRDAVKAAEMTARFTHAAFRDTAIDVIDTCRAAAIPVTLLKGISISDQCYPEPHLRPMGDIDLYLSESDCALLESRLVRVGFAPMSDFEAGECEAHGAPLCDPNRQVWIEPHMALFPKDAPVSRSSLFAPPGVDRGSVPSTFHGRSVRRLTSELQLVYIASYWLRDITRNQMHPSLLIPLLDALYLLRASAQSLDWTGLLDSLDNETATASLHLLLTQVTRYGLVEEIAPVLARLSTKQRMLGAGELGVMNALLDFRLVDGRKFMGSFGDRHPMIESSVLDTLLSPRPFAYKIASLPWNLFFPPRVPERYSMGYHAGRLGRLLRTRR